MADADLLRRLGPELELLLPELDEKARRLVLGMAARAAGDGGTGAVARLTGASWQTVADGAAELASGDTAPPGRVRRAGAGRRKLAEADPGLVPALLALVRDSSRGDPCSPLLWTTRSAKNLSGALTAAGHRCSPQTAWRLLREQGFSTQANAKVAEGRRHPDRDAQFRYIAGQAKEHLAAGQPVISVDAKKKELIGNYARAGAEWRPAGDPVKARSHDFPDKNGGHVIPYGVYDVGANTGFVNVGTDHGTAAFAVESVRRWQDLIGRDAYPQATRLLICCDAGGSNDWRSRAWKAGLAALAQETGLEITVCHFPPGTSKWNKIEHRLFSQITLAWRGRPLTSHDVVVNTIGAVTTATGLSVTAVLDAGSYPTGTRVSDEQMRDLEDRALTRHGFHGEWNYAFPPVLRPAPEPEPGPPPALPGPDLDALAHPALTGMTRAALGDLAASLELPYAAAREQRLHLDRGGPRAGRPKGPAAPVKLSLPACLLAALLRYRSGMTCQLIAGLLGVDHSTISVTTRHIAGLLASQGTVITPGPHRIRTLDDLHRHAAAADIAIPHPPAGPAPAGSTTPGPATPQTHLTLECLLCAGYDPRSCAGPQRSRIARPRKGPGRNGAFRAFEHTVVQSSEVVQLARARAGHFDLGTGYHGDLWLDLDALFLRPGRLRPYVDWLAERLRGHGVDAVCGPLEGGAFLAYAVADRLGVAFLAGYRAPGVASYHLPAVHGGIGGWRVGVVDDAVNAGTAIAACLEELRSQRAVPVAAAGVIALGEASTMVPARLGVPFYAAGTMPSRAWPAPECPLCADGVPVTPGADGVLVTPGDGRSAPPAGR